jgi:hypothetical protein
MTARRFVVGSIAALGACTGQDLDKVPLEEISANPLNWDGEAVTVDGWLLQCRELDCHIVPTAQDLDLIANACPGEKCEIAIETFDKRAVSLGGDEEFDRAARPLEGSHVLLTAKVNAASWSRDCLDRCDALQPISIAPFPQ